MPKLLVLSDEKELMKHPKRTLEGAIGSYFYHKHLAESYKEKMAQDRKTIMRAMNSLGKRQFKSRYGRITAIPLNDSEEITKVLIRHRKLTA